ncbi:MAG: 30S ribosomal protein S3 [Gammaproteobacteria bacterium]
MGQKIHPTGIRLGIVKDWLSRWYADAKTYPEYLRLDREVRDYIHKNLKEAAVGRVVIERTSRSVRVVIHSGRPGVIIGAKGKNVEELRTAISNIVGMSANVSIKEIRKPEIDAQLVAESVAAQLERRVMFRRAMKRAVSNALRAGAEGIKIKVSGRLAGAEIARSEWYREGRVPLHTLRADIDYGFAEALTTYGIIGVKVWIFKGEIIGTQEEQTETTAETAA